MSWSLHKNRWKESLIFSFSVHNCILFVFFHHMQLLTIDIIKIVFVLFFLLNISSYFSYWAIAVKEFIHFVGILVFHVLNLFLYVFIIFWCSSKRHNVNIVVMNALSCPCPYSIQYFIYRTYYTYCHQKSNT